MGQIVTVKQVNKSFFLGDQKVEILKDVSLTINEGDFVVITGPSGCGKSTLLHTMLGLEPPDNGEVSILDNNIYLNTTEDDRCEFRKKNIGMVYQQPNWIRSLTVIENVAFPLLLLGYDRIDTLRYSIPALRSLGMLDWQDRFPSELSGGQQQKVALARALITEPKLIVADEPTGNLDFKSGQELMDLLTGLNKKGKTIIMVTHDLEYIKFAKQAIKMFDGKIVEVFDDAQKSAMQGEFRGKRGEQDSSSEPPKNTAEIKPVDKPIKSTPKSVSKNDSTKK